MLICTCCITESKVQDHVSDNKASNPLTTCTTAACLDENMKKLQEKLELEFITRIFKKYLKLFF